MPKTSIAKVVEIYNSSNSIRATAKELKISFQTVRKILITEGLYSDEKTIRINEFLSKGLTVEEICSKLKMSEKYLNSYLPYTKGCSVASEPSKNAKHIRECRERKKENLWSNAH